MTLRQRVRAVYLVGLLTACSDEAVGGSDAGAKAGTDAALDAQVTREAAVGDDASETSNASGLPIDAGPPADLDASVCLTTLRNGLAPRAPCNRVALCAQLAREPDTRAHFLFAVADATARACLVTAAREMGVAAVGDPSGFVEFDATFRAAEPLLDLDIVSYIQASCPVEGDDAHCPHCAGLDDAACALDARCSSYEAVQLDRAAGCQRSVELGCGVAERGCNELIGYAESADGVCYRFPDLCFPAFLTPTTREACELEGAPACP